MFTCQTLNLRSTSNQIQNVTTEFQCNKLQNDQNDDVDEMVPNQMLPAKIHFRRTLVLHAAPKKNDGYT